MSRLFRFALRGMHAVQQQELERLRMMQKNYLCEANQLRYERSARRKLKTKLDEAGRCLHDAEDKLLEKSTEIRRQAEEIYQLKKLCGRQ
eukprot:1489902-Pleurochrysis_carterae.AAC.1